MKYEITKDQLRSLTDPKVQAFIGPTFEYLEEVEVSDYEDFSSYDVVRYGCKHVKGYYLCFNKNEYAITAKYIKKLKP